MEKELFSSQFLLILYWYLLHVPHTFLQLFHQVSVCQRLLWASFYRVAPHYVFFLLPAFLCSPPEPFLYRTPDKNEPIVVSFGSLFKPYSRVRMKAQNNILLRCSRLFKALKVGLYAISKSNPVLAVPDLLFYSSLWLLPRFRGIACVAFSAASVLRSQTVSHRQWVQALSSVYSTAPWPEMRQAWLALTCVSYHRNE